MCNVSVEEGDKIVGVDIGYLGVFFVKGGWVNLLVFVIVLFKVVDFLSVCNNSKIDSYFNCYIEKFEKIVDGWLLYSKE